MGELRDEKIKDSLRRLEKMDEEDILSMSRPAQWRLALGFTHEELVRRIVAKGTDRYWKLRILEELGKAYRVGYMSLSNNDRYKYAQNGFTEAWPPYFEDIDFDIATNTSLLPDENSPLPNPNSSPSGEAGRGLLEACISELEKENEALRQQLAPEEHCEEEEHCPEEGVLRNKVSFECFLQLLEQAGCDLNNTGNKTRAGALWHMMTGKSAQDLRRYCSGRDYNNNHTKTDIARLDTLLSDLGITSLKLRQ